MTRQLDVTIREEQIRVVVVEPRGWIDTFTVGPLREQLDALLDAGQTNLVIDLSGVTFLDSAGMAAFVSVYKRTRQAGGDTHLVWPQEEAVRRILRLTSFDRVFTMFDTAENAVRGF